ncbi:hypothetical protein C8F04DRAFT_257947 [Mycena alexandri]|uniref:Uncharacterized protein n=1 Tax=Mycena alexandri TaxID=1745969 RepID=A0AAD6WUU0_9AGAR|nr:hypothetical protein C8F04DRAFT_257947 [Mycena alexandri]
MDNDDEHITVSVVKEPVFASNGGILFPDAHHFTVTGGTFVNNHVTVPALLPDLRMIPLGDIDLQQELLVNMGSGVIGHGPRCVRRVYAAKVHDRTSNVTVALYEGDGAEDVWRRDVASYMAIRHPNIVQIFGGASYGNIHATIFHGDLVPLKQFVAAYLPITTVYLYACYWNEWNVARKYLTSTFQRLTWIDPSECTLWIRGSTGRLSADLVPPDLGDAVSFELDWAPHLPAITSLPTEDKRPADFISPSTTVTLGVVTSCPVQDHYEDRVEIASLPEITVRIAAWRLLESTLGDLMENGWKRYRADDAFNTEIKLELYSLFLSHFWLSQANHIFRRLQIAHKLEDYTLTSNITFTILTSNAGEETPPGFLFLCPKEAFQTAPGSFKWPDCPAYWSLDPSGEDHLSNEQAMQLGFPPMELKTSIAGRCWDSSVYAGLRDFHRAKGFDPDSQAVGRHLGYPLFRLRRELDPHFAHAIISGPT